MPPHFLKDTEEADSAGERYWPDGFKKVIRKEIHKVVLDELKKERAFENIYRDRYSERFRDFGQFVDRIAEMVVIGAENGADEAFDELHASFVAEKKLPDARRYAYYLWPRGFYEETKEEIRKAIVQEYSKERSYRHAYEHYRDKFRDFAEFMSEVAELIIVGVANGADDMLGKIYKSFLNGGALPPARRYPRRLKDR